MRNQGAGQRSGGSRGTWGGARLALEGVRQPHEGGARAAPLQPAAAVGDADPPSAHFAAIVVHVQRLEFLYLAHTGNRRAASTYGDGARRPEWLIP